MKKLIFIVCVFTSCIKESTTSSVAFIKNGTTHKIEIIPYLYGSVVIDNVVTILPNNQVQIANGSERGIVNHGGFHSEKLGNADSLQVRFDDIYTITHYYVNPIELNNKYYLYSSLRNLGNYLSYEYTFEDVSKYSRHATYVYNFTEQDYLDAK